ncbi:linker for activation of T-cells family member 2 [Erinaceus europaeus]|uniref:Linker for activation of T-cells family member 2 n=1 Tax=Erinaceus europaeus TaxID=9365 RepID=A0ABM3VYU9_ERIEU|nr:linker for activation of T-cells family member 2 [Erinaceus europaeus]
MMQADRKPSEATRLPVCSAGLIAHSGWGALNEDPDWQGVGGHAAGGGAAVARGSPATAAASGGGSRLMCELLPPRCEELREDLRAEESMPQPQPVCLPVPLSRDNGKLGHCELCVQTGDPAELRRGPDLLPTDKLRCFSSSQEDSEAPRYQNFSKGSRLGSEAAYVDPIASEYYNWGCFHKPLEGDEDANSYENVLICSQSPESGDDDYQNALSVQQWHESRRVSEQIHRVTPPSPDEDGDPDYVNGDMNMGQA